MHTVPHEILYQDVKFTRNFLPNRASLYIAKNTLNIGDHVLFKAKCAQSSLPGKPLFSAPTRPEFLLLSPVNKTTAIYSSAMTPTITP